MVFKECKIISAPFHTFSHFSRNFDPEALQSGFGVKFFFWGLVNLGKLPANVSANFSSDFLSAHFSALFLQGFKAPPQKKNHITPKIVGILQIQILEPIFLSRRSSAYGENQEMFTSFFFFFFFFFFFSYFFSEFYPQAFYLKIQKF